MSPVSRLKVPVVAVLLGLLATFAAPTIAANAATVRPTVITGDRTLSLTWPGTAQASYKVTYATNRALHHVQNRTSGTNHVALTGLTNGKTYYVRVSASTGWHSTIIAATPTNRFPQDMPNVTVSQGPVANTLLIKWQQLHGITKLRVLASGYNMHEQENFASPWLPATTTSYVLHIPASLIPLLGSNAGNAVYVRVGEYNNAHAPASSGLQFNLATRYRVSPGSVFGFARFANPTGTKLSVATYNVQAITAEAPDHPWAVRRNRVAANIAYSGADLVAAQEDDAAASASYQGVRQYKDLAGLLAQSQYGGYTMSGDLPANYRFNNDLEDAWLYYKPTVLTRLDGGFISPRDDLNVGWPSGFTDRRATWAKFRINATGTIFYAVTVHLPVDDGKTSYNALRTREGSAIASYMRAKAGSTPIVFMGDFNSDHATDGYCIEDVLNSTGWYNADATSHRTNRRYATTNQYITHPAPALNVSSAHIDYIYTYNAPGSYAYVNQQLMDNHGDLLPAYHGSDHNLQFAVLGIP